MNWRNRQFNSTFFGICLTPLAVIGGLAIVYKFPWIVIVLGVGYASLLPLTFIHDFIWWPSKTHCMTCIERARSSPQ